ncbi:tellurite resistance TerB family protein [Minwuia sp.]|uniref:tellurite resistance TerB family protein n=1 Tax=Minwuia sp. TaxID=2493630 RepID=UPI003A8CE771
MAAKMSTHSALVHVMVLTACADKELADQEITLMGEMIKTWPVFRSYDLDHLSSDAESCLAYLEQEDGIDELMSDVSDVLPARLAETAYALACDVAAADGDVSQTELEVLMIIRQSLGVGRLPAAAIERGARARAMTI